MEPFEAIDFYDIESLLTEEEIMIRDLVRLRIGGAAAKVFATTREW